MSAYDAQEAVDFIRQAAGNDIDIIFGVAINDKIGESIIVTVIATGFDLPKPELLASAQPAGATIPSSAGKGLEVEVDTDTPAFGAEKVEIEEGKEDSDIPNFFSRN